jgi:hypothetical protein
MSWSLGHAGLLLALWLFPLGSICAALLAVIIAVRSGGLAVTCRRVGAWFWSTGYGIDAFKAEQRLHFRKCMEIASDPAAMLEVAEVGR